jgi:hypothetical protein
MGLPDESALFAEAKDNGQPSDGLKAVGDAATNASPPASDENARALSHAKTCQSISMR